MNNSKATLDGQLHKAKCDRHILYGFAELVAGLTMGEGISSAGLDWLIENAKTAIERADEND